MALPQRTAEQRAKDLKAATKMRHDRRAVKDKLKAGKVSICDLVEKADDKVIGGIPLVQALESLPGIGKARAQSALKELGIPASKRIRGLGVRQRAHLVERFG